MAVCAKLHKTEEEVAHWTLDRIALWLAYFKITEEERAKAIAKNKGSSGSVQKPKARSRRKL